MDMNITENMKLQRRVKVQNKNKNNIFLFNQHILTKKLQSPGTISFGVPGNQPAKICPKVTIRYRNINFEYCSLQELEQILQVHETYINKCKN